MVLGNSLALERCTLQFEACKMQAGVVHCALRCTLEVRVMRKRGVP